jgi:hypothetical protein
LWYSSRVDAFNNLKEWGWCGSLLFFLRVATARTEFIQGVFGCALGLGRKPFAVSTNHPLPRQTLSGKPLFHSAIHTFPQFFTYQDSPSPHGIYAVAKLPASIHETARKR